MFDELKSTSMVKQKCNSKYQTTTADLPKISSPKVRDDPFGSSSPRIASGFLYRSDLRGVTLDLPVITSMKSHAIPFGLLLSCIASDVPDSWLIFQLKQMLYGSLPRPHESCFASSLLCRFTELVCVWFMHSIYKNLGSRTVCCVVVQELCTNSEDSFRPQNISRQGESHKSAIDTCCLDLYQADCYTLLHLVSLVCEVGDIGSATFSVADVFNSIHVTTTAVRALRLCLFIKTEADYFESTRHQFLELSSLIQQMEISSESCCFMLAFLYHAKFRFHITSTKTEPRLWLHWIYFCCSF